MGRLLYLTISKPDITYGVQQLSQFMAAPTDHHMKVAMRLLRYLKGTQNMQLRFSNNAALKVKAYCDSDWGSCLDTKRSITGYCIFLGNSLISWKAKK